MILGNPVSAIAAALLPGAVIPLPVPCAVALPGILFLPHLLRGSLLGPVRVSLLALRLLRLPLFLPPLRLSVLSFLPLGLALLLALRLLLLLSFRSPALLPLRLLLAFLFFALLFLLRPLLFVLMCENRCGNS